MRYGGDASQTRSRFVLAPQFHAVRTDDDVFLTAAKDGRTGRVVTARIQGSGLVDRSISGCVVRELLKAEILSGPRSWILKETVSTDEREEKKGTSDTSFVSPVADCRIRSTACTTGRATITTYSFLCTRSSLLLASAQSYFTISPIS
jgi:hypothetical protein